MLALHMLEHIFLNNMIDVKDLVVSETKFGKIAYYKNDLAFAQEAIKNKIFEENLIIDYLLDIIKYSKTIVDIGAHAGSHTIIYKSLNVEILRKIMIEN